MKEQLEITLPARTMTSTVRPRRNYQRRQRAQYWFNQMRQAVETAFDWKAAPAARPEQIYFALEKTR